MIKHKMPNGSFVHLVGWNRSSVFEVIMPDGSMIYKLAYQGNVRITNRIYDLPTDFMRGEFGNRKDSAKIIKFRYRPNRSFFVSYGEHGKVKRFKHMRRAFKFALSVASLLNSVFYTESGNGATLIYDRAHVVEIPKFLNISLNTVRKYRKLLDKKIRYV